MFKIVTPFIIKFVSLITIVLISCNSNNKIDNKETMEYQNKLNECKKSYPFNRWKESFSHGLEQYTEENCNKVKEIFDNLIAGLISAGENISETEKVALFKTAILASNELNNEIDGLIETGEREDLCDLTDIITRASGLDPEKYGGGEGLASEWRDW